MFTANKEQLLLRPYQYLGHLRVRMLHQYRQAQISSCDGADDDGR